MVETDELNLVYFNLIFGFFHPPCAIIWRIKDVLTYCSYMCLQVSVYQVEKCYNFSWCSLIKVVQH